MADLKGFHPGHDAAALIGDEVVEVEMHGVIMIDPLWVSEWGVVGRSVRPLNRIQGKYMLENKKLSDREILYQFLRRIPIQNRTIAYDIVNRDLNENRVLKVPNNNVM